MKTLHAAVAATALLVAPLAARADSPDDVERAKTLYKAGEQAYTEGKLAAAIQAFEEANKIAPRPFIVFNMALAEKKQYFLTFQADDLKRAVKHFREYLDKQPTGGRSADAINALAELGPRLADLEARQGMSTTPPPAPPPPVNTLLMVTTQTSGVSISIDGAPPTTSLSAEVTPGKHRIRIAADGYFPEEREPDVVKGTVVALDITLRERPASLTLSAPSGADVTVDGRLVATTPLAQPVDVAPGTHYLVVAKNGMKAFAREVAFERGKTAHVDARLEASGQRTTAYVFLGTGVAGLVAGGVFTGVSFAEQGRAQGILDQKSRGNITGPDLASYNSALDQRDQWKTVSLVTFGASVAVLTIGTILYLFDKPSAGPAPAADVAPKPVVPKKPEPEFGVAPMIGPGAFGLAVGGRM